MEIRKGSSLSRVEIARARLQYYGRAAVEAAWEQMVRNGFAAELEATDARREIDARRKKRTSSDLKMASVRGVEGNCERTYQRSASLARTLQSVPDGAQLDRYGQRIFDASKHPRAPAGRPDGGQFIEVRGGASRNASRSVGHADKGTIKSAVRLPRLEREQTPVASRMDSLWQGTGVFWSVDGRPWELSSQDIRDWKAITERGPWTEGWNAVAPMFWTSIPEFEAEVKRKARSYRDRMLLVEGAPNPSDVFKRRRERAQTARLADAEEAFTTIDNATSFAGVAKAPLKAGIKSVFRTAKGRAVPVLAETVNKARPAIVIKAERNELAGAITAMPSPRQSNLGQLVDSGPMNSLKHPVDLDDVSNVINNTALATPRPIAKGRPSTTVHAVDSWKLRHEEITRRLNEHLSHALKQAKLTPAQRRDVMKNGSASMHWGTQIDNKFKNLVQNDYLLRGEVVVSPRRLPKDAVAPDVIDLRSKRWWDVTSTADAFAKKPPKYGIQYGDGTSLLYNQP